METYVLTYFSDSEHNIKDTVIIKASLECPGCYPYYNKTALNRVYHGVTNSLMAM